MELKENFKSEKNKIYQQKFRDKKKNEMLRIEKLIEKHEPKNELQTKSFVEQLKRNLKKCVSVFRNEIRLVGTSYISKTDLIDQLEYLLIAIKKTEAENGKNSRLKIVRTYI